MNDAQAIPDNLFSYSDQTTGASTDLQQWISSVLTPAVQLYQETALDLGNNIDDLTTPHTGTIDADTRNVLSSVSGTDKQVRAAGQAFLDAGDNGKGSVTFPAWFRNHPDPGGDPTQYAIVSTPDSVIGDDLSHQQGAQLAEYELKYGPDAYVFQQLAEHQNDPAFTAAFFNGLTPVRVNTLLITYGDWRGAAPPNGQDESGVLAQALASAYANGQLSPAIEKQIDEWLVLMPANRFRPLFYAALAKNPQAALNFINSLTAQQFSKLAAGAFGRPWQSEFIEICTAAIKTCPDGPSAYALFLKITKAVTSGDTWNPYESDGQAIADLMAAVAAKMIPNPPAGADQQELEVWTGTIGSTIRKLLKPWMDWLKTTEASNQQTNANVKTVVSTIVNKVVGLIPAPAFEESVATVGKALWNHVVGQSSTDLTNIITQAITEPTENSAQSQAALANATTLMAKRLAIAKLLAEGAIYPGSPEREGTQPVAATVANIDAIVQAANDPNSAAQYSIRAPGGDLLTYFFLSAVQTRTEA